MRVLVATWRRLTDPLESLSIGIDFDVPSVTVSPFLKQVSFYPPCDLRSKPNNVLRGVVASGSLSWRRMCQQPLCP